MSDESNLTDIKAATDEDGLLKAWISDIDIDREKPTIVMETALGDTIEKTYTHPRVWSNDHKLVELLENANIEPETVNEIHNLEIRYDTEDDTIHPIDAAPDVDGTPLSEAAKEYAELKQNTINDDWIWCEVTDVNITAGSVLLEIRVPNYGSLTYKYNKPKSWREEYRIVRLCNELGVSSSKELVGRGLAVSTTQRVNVPTYQTAAKEHVAQSDPLEYRQKKLDFMMGPLEYAESVPERETSDNSTSDSGEVPPLVGVILMSALTVMIVILAAIIGTFVLGLGDTLGAVDSNAVSIEEHPSEGTIEVTHEPVHEDYTVIIKEDGEVVGQLDGSGDSYIHEPSDSSGTLVVYTGHGEGHVFDRYDYNFS